MKAEELTWKDIRRIVISADDLCDEWGTEKMHEEGQQAYYEEILRRFNE